jgi:hypothetical protein
MRYGIIIHKNENEFRIFLKLQIHYTVNTNETGAAAMYNRYFTSSQNYVSFIGKTQLPGICS